MRRGLRLLVNLEPDLEVCGEAEDAKEALECLCEQRPDVAVVDLTLKTSSGLDLISRFRARCPQLRILVVTMHDGIDWIRGALQAGADGYLTKDQSAERLICAIRCILAGQQYLSPRTAQQLKEHAG